MAEDKNEKVKLILKKIKENKPSWYRKYVAFKNVDKKEEEKPD